MPRHDSASLNEGLINVLKHADKVVICGEALSHCVNYTVRDLVDAWPAERIQDLVLLTDCASSVPGFESSGQVCDLAHCFCKKLLMTLRGASLTLSLSLS